MWGDDWIKVDKKMLIVPGYLKLKKRLDDRFRDFEKCGISRSEIMEAWKKCGVAGIHLDAFMIGRTPSKLDSYDEVPEGWADRYGDQAYWISMKELEPGEIRAEVKRLAKEYPFPRIKPSEFYRTLYYYEIAHTLPRSGHYLIEFCWIKGTEKYWKPWERIIFEGKAWRWAVKMAKRRNPKIRVLYRTVDIKRKQAILRHLEKQRKEEEKQRTIELAKREKGQALRKAA